MIKDIHEVKECPECASMNIVYNDAKSQVICRDCGLIYEPLTPKEEVREFLDLVHSIIDKLREKLANAENTLSRIGSVNLRALEVYDDIKAEYDKIKEKVEQLEKEKQEILKIIEQIDRKKKKTFLNTLNQINQLFSNNFSHLSTKRIVTLEVQNKKDPFEEY